MKSENHRNHSSSAYVSIFEHVDRNLTWVQETSCKVYTTVCPFGDIKYDLLMSLPTISTAPQGLNCNNFTQLFLRFNVQNMQVFNTCFCGVFLIKMPEKSFLPSFLPPFLPPTFLPSLLLYHFPSSLPSFFFLNFLYSKKKNQTKKTNLLELLLKFIFFFFPTPKLAQGPTVILANWQASTDSKLFWALPHRIQAFELGPLCKM